MSGIETELGTVALLDASDDTIVKIRTLLTESGASQRLIHSSLFDFKRGITDFRKYLTAHNPEVVVFDISPPYGENWAFIITVRDAAEMQGRGVVLTTTNKKELDAVSGEDSYALEITGNPVNRSLVLQAIQAATRTSRRRVIDGAS